MQAALAHDGVFGEVVRGRKHVPKVVAPTNRMPHPLVEQAIILLQRINIEVIQREAYGKNVGRHLEGTSLGQRLLGYPTP